MATRPPEEGPNAPLSDPAKGRFLAINAMRLSGVALVIVGLLVLQQVIGLPQVAGWALLVVGLIDVFVVPQVLARKWRSPPQ